MRSVVGSGGCFVGAVLSCRHGNYPGPYHSPVEHLGTSVPGCVVISRRRVAVAATLTAASAVVTGVL